jgi:hypothetical protein
MASASLLLQIVSCLSFTTASMSQALQSSSTVVVQLGIAEAQANDVCVVRRVASVGQVAAVSGVSQHGSDDGDDVCMSESSEV